jgi:hypothetical protein
MQNAIGHHGSVPDSNDAVNAERHQDLAPSCSAGHLGGLASIPESVLRLTVLRNLASSH